MSIVRKLTEKPWLTPGLDTADAQRPEMPPGAAALVGLRLYFVVVTIMFLLIAAAYLMHRGVGHGMAMEHSGGSSLPSLPMLWFNTAMLVLSSLAWERARITAETGLMEQSRTALIVGGVLTFIFVGGQLAAWWQLRSMPEAQAVAIFFYLISAIHGLHLIGGLVAWGRTLANLSPDADAAGIATSVRLCAAYWHFLLLVWLAMFALLLSA